MKTIADDIRPIISISTYGESGFYWSISDAGTTKIEPYHESGEMSDVVWFAIYGDRGVVRRVNGKFVDCIRYEDAA